MNNTHVPIRNKPNPNCIICGSIGDILYQNLNDRLYSVSGDWTIKKCSVPSCGLLWLDPMPLEEDLGKLYSSYFTHIPSKVRQESQPLILGKRFFKYVKHGYLASRYSYCDGVSRFQRILGSLVYLFPLLIRSFNKGVRYIDYIPNGKLLDVGCGDGSYLKYMQSLGWDVEGVEFDPLAIANMYNTGISVKYGSIMDCNYPNEWFDVITLNHVIEHVINPLEVLSECHRIIKPGGKIILSTPNASSRAHNRFGSNWMNLDPPRHLHIFNISTMRYLTEKAGLKITKCFTSAESANTLLVNRSICENNYAELHGAYSFSESIWAYSIVIREGIINFCIKDRGQELVLIMEK